MSRIEEARQRLARAVARLESARHAQAGPAPGDIGDLIRALEEAQRENAALVAERDAMADRVDAIVGEIRGVAGTNDNDRAGSG